MNHLGVVLANNTRSHAEARIQSARRAFYSLQGAGLCVKGCSPSTISRIYTTAIRPVLTYGLECVYQGKTVMNQVEVIQGKCLKAALGLKYYCKTSPLLHALNIDRVSTSIEIHQLALFKSMFFSSSRTSVLCKFLLSEFLKGGLSSHKNLVSAVMKTCDKHNISMAQYLCESSHKPACKRRIRTRPECGIADSVKYVLNSSHDVLIINDLLSPF